MITPVVMAMLIGAAAGTRCNVLIFAPIIAIGSAAMFGAGMAQDNGLWSTLLGMGLALVALQMGYLSGMATRFAFAGSRVHKRLPATLVAVQRPAR